jgi:hypothetical protein
LTEQWAAGLAAWTDRAKFTAALEALVDELPDQGALATVEQQKRLAALEAELLALGHLEESIVTAAYERGVDLAPRRPNASPACVLGLKIVAAKKALAAAE